MRRPADDFDWLDDIETYAKDVPWRYAQVLIAEVRQGRDDVDYWHGRAKSQQTDSEDAMKLYDRGTFWPFRPAGPVNQPMWWLRNRHLARFRMWWRNGGSAS